MWGHRGTRARALLDDYRSLVAVALVVLAVAGGALVYTTHVNPGTETTTRSVDVGQSTAAFDHAATVQRSNPVFTVGETLENRSLYFTRVSPELDGSFVYGFAAPDGELAVEIDTRLQLRSVGEEGQVFWQVEEPLASESGTVAPGEAATADFTVNVSEVLARIDGIEADLGASPGQTEVRVLSSVVADGTVAGTGASHEETYALTLQPDASTYSVSGPGTATDPHQQVEQATTVRTFGPLRGLGGPLLLLASLLGLVVLGAAWATGRLDVAEPDREALAFASTRAEFDDWISRGRISAAARDRPHVRITDLEDLVDVAIDHDARVVEDVDGGSFVVLADGVVYEYDRPWSAGR